MPCDGDDASSLCEMATDIVARSDGLLREMAQLRQRCLAVRGQNQHVQGLSLLVSAVRQERKTAQQFLDSLDAAAGGAAAPRPANAQALESRFRFTNLPAIERHWDIVKRCRDVVALEQQIAKTPKMESSSNGGLQKVRRSGPGTTHNKNQDSDTVFVHAVVDGGEEWLRIISKDQKRLMIELAEGGWDWGVDGEDDDDDDDATLFEDIQTLRIARELVDTSRKNWHNYRHPRIRIVFTRIKQDENAEIARLLRKLRRAGGDDITVTVNCAESEWLATPPPADLDGVLANLLPPEDMSYLGDTVLLDTSVLIAMVSDVSHARVERQPWQGGDLRAHIEDEESGISFLVSNAYPRLRGRELVCAEQAMRHFWDITTTMGSATELKRARVLLEGGPAELQELSIHRVPEDLRLPVRVLDDATTDSSAAELVRQGRVPEVAMQVERQLLNVPGNRVTHLYGWACGLAVVTSNRTLARRLVRMVEKSLAGDYQDGPKICSLPYNRALATNGPGPKKAQRLLEQAAAAMNGLQIRG